MIEKCNDKNCGDSEKNLVLKVNFTETSSYDFKSCSFNLQKIAGTDLNPDSNNENDESSKRRDDGEYNENILQG